MVDFRQLFQASELGAAGRLSFGGFLVLGFGQPLKADKFGRPLMAI